MSLNLSSNYVATGTFVGTWSFNAQTKTLTIKAAGVGTIKLKVERELDWESNPRVPTLVYSGLNASGYSLWGKKIP